MQHGEWREGVPVWIAPPAEQWYTITDFRAVEVTDSRTDPQSGETITRTHRSTAGFDVIRVGSAHEDLLGLAGFDDDGDFVLERWSLVPVLTGGLAGAGASSPSGPSGGPIGDPDDATLPAKRFVKTRIYEGPLGSAIHGIDFDAEARFLLVLLHEGGVSTLWRFENAVSVSPTMVLDSVGTPALARSRRLTKFDHQMLGRIWVLEDHPLYSQRIVLVDEDNDGVFDGAPILGDREYFSATGIDAYELWDDLLGP